MCGDKTESGVHDTITPGEIETYAEMFTRAVLEKPDHEHVKALIKVALTLHYNAGKVAGMLTTVHPIINVELTK